MLISNKEKLIRLEERFQYDLKKYTDYTLDLNIDENDYSVEYLLIKSIYSFNCYERAAGELKIDSIQSELKIYKNEIESCIEDADEEKINDFIKDYFSVSRLKTNLLSLEDKTVNNREDDENTDLAHNYFSIIDNAKLLSADYSNYSWYKHIDQSELEKVFKNNIYLFSYYADTIKNLMDLNMVPNNAINSWWYQVRPLSEERVSSIFEQYSIKMKQNIFISDIIIESAGSGMEKLQQLQEGISEAVSWGRNQLPEFNSLLSDFISEPRIVPAYKTWSDAEQKETSDYEVTVETFKNVASFNKEIIEDLIDLVNEKEEQIDHQKRKEILATAYLMLGKSQKAIDILDSE